MSYRAPAGWLLVGAWLCSSCGAPAVVEPAAPASGANAPKRTVQLCADLRMSARGQQCIAPLRPEEQRHRSFTARLELEAGQVLRFQRLNGRGALEPDDEGCVEFRYRYDGEYIAESVGYRLDGTICDRSLWTDRATRLSYVDEWGRPDFSRDRVHTAMLLDHDTNGMVIRQRPLGADGQPVTLSLAGEVRFQRDAARLEQRICYFDGQGKPIKNAGGVHCWTYDRDRFGNDLVQQAWDEQGAPAAGADGVHRFVRVFDGYGNLVRRSAFGVDGNPLTIERSHCPAIAYHRDEFGFLLGADCRDEADRAARFDEGNSYWRSTPDRDGRVRESRYFDASGRLMTSDVGYARVELERDAHGHVTQRRFFLADGTPGQTDGPSAIRYEWNAQHLEVRRSFWSASGRPGLLNGCASLDTEHNQFRRASRQICRDADGKPTLSSDKVSITEWSYDARGQLAETRHLDVAGRPIDSKRGFFKKVHRYDARGLESGSQHFKVDGSELKLPRYSVLWVRPPLSDAFWPASSRERALLEVETAHRELLAGLPWHAALVRHGDEKVYAALPGDSGYLNLDTLWPALRAVLQPLAVGEYSRIVEIPYGLAIYQRTE